MKTKISKISEAILFYFGILFLTGMTVWMWATENKNLSIFGEVVMTIVIFIIIAAAIYIRITNKKGLIQKKE